MFYKQNPFSMQSHSFLKALYFLCFNCFIFHSTAYGNVDVDGFITENRTDTYSCPDANTLATLDEYLSRDDLTENQLFNLSVEKTHLFMCEGRVIEAIDILKSQIEKPEIDKTSYFYASAIYQIGFGYDTQESPERCGFYEKAIELSSPTLHSDVFLSASLGRITNCLKSSSVTDRLEALFRILQKYSKSENNDILAQIHNNIGLVYGKELEQYALAAEQYMKAHEFAKEEAEGTEKISFLISAVTAQLASGKIQQAHDSIQEFERINKTINTPLSNFYYFHALSSYYYRTGNFNEMKLILPELVKYAEPLSNSYINAVVAWYGVAICVDELDIPCIDDYIKNNQYLPFENSQFFWSLKVQMHILLDQKEEALSALDIFEKAVFKRYYTSQDSAGILGVAKLYSQIEALEKEIELERKIRQYWIAGGFVGLAFGIIVLVYILRKKQLARMAIDPVTELLNSRTAVNRIGKVDVPEWGRTNAIAIFDLGNFRELNRVLGATSSDRVIRQIARSLQKVTRANDILGRFGPEQFVLCLHNIEEQSAKQFFDRVQTELDNTVFHEGQHNVPSVDSSMSVFTTTEKFIDLDAVFDEMLMSINITKSKA
ncbi:GGDEF domain-containing protein [Alteromonas sp. 5E99-2]|uniref:GGDEF domain-containing protein n=1 Tax=Alteromonas sp. 5E99-2 TaxID=2817683 RepID=UPI001A97D5B7|nr:GGDEF domain-containing protein [Alteromonas sp. 5E99-2]MBO1257016.1 GGDEF domain-containing protein [Alteromonas sp. 5E99-2]